MPTSPNELTSSQRGAKQWPRSYQLHSAKRVRPPVDCDTEPCRALRYGWLAGVAARAASSSSGGLNGSYEIKSGAASAFLASELSGKFFVQHAAMRRRGALTGTSATKGVRAVHQPRRVRKLTRQERERRCLDDAGSAPLRTAQLACRKLCSSSCCSIEPGP